MSSQNCNPDTASTANAASKGVEPREGTARRSVGRSLQQELMTLKMSGAKGISAFPESDNLFKWVGTIHGAAQTAISVWTSSRASGQLCTMSGPSCLLGEPNIDSLLNTHSAELWTDLTPFKKYLLEIYMKQVTSQEPGCPSSCVYVKYA
ncbi:ubiquitin-conjugating enzyme E2 C-like [Notamacropus eugenii]|uniref:ubiquitin-conjugating enzyme E2 C-like n=1 Tax=Notamacropus eugenii TaxID=9315 RepID=UPI003B66F632